MFGIPFCLETLDASMTCADADVTGYGVSYRLLSFTVLNAANDGYKALSIQLHGSAWMWLNPCLLQQLLGRLVTPFSPIPQISAIRLISIPLDL